MKRDDAGTDHLTRTWAEQVANDRLIAQFHGHAQTSLTAYWGPLADSDGRLGWWWRRADLDAKLALAERLYILGELDPATYSGLARAHARAHNQRALLWTIAEVAAILLFVRILLGGM